MDKLLPSFRDSVLSPISDPTFDLLEAGLDSVLETDALKAIPVVGTISAFCKVGINLHERNLIKQTFEFIKGFNDGSLDKETIEAHRIELENDPKKQEKELSRVVIILGKQVDELQSQVLGSFYSSFVRGAISWNKFCELSEANSRMFSSDYSILSRAAYEDGINLDGQELYQVDRLISLGLLTQSRQTGNPIFNVSGETLGLLNSKKPGEKDVKTTSFGKTFYQHMPQVLKRNSIS